MPEEREPLFVIDTVSVSTLGATIFKEAQGQWHIDAYNLDGVKTGLNSAIQQLPPMLGEPVGPFVYSFYTNYSALLNQRAVIGQILENKVAPDAEALDLQIRDSFDLSQ